MTELDGPWTELAQMWQTRDPMPERLVDKVLVAIATEDMDTEYELLQLVERSRELQGTRATEGSLTIEFSGGAFSMLLRVTEVDATHRRVDGWVSPAKPMRVSVRQSARSWDADVSRLGRFEFANLPVGLSRFWLFGDDQVDDDHLFATPTFEL